jgi:4-hydroxybenzoate polyprenyltransferase
LANLFLTAFIHAFNDVEDAEDDYHVMKKRKRNPVAGGELSKNHGYIFSFFLLSIGLFLLSIISPLVFFLGSILSMVGFFYSWGPVRFKSKPVIDLISHIVCLGILQLFITYLTFRSFDMFIVPFLMIIVPISFMIEIFYELKDVKVDKKTKIKNTIQILKRFDIKNLLIFMSVIVIAGFVLILFTLSLEYQIVMFIGSIFLGFMTISHVKKILRLIPN